MIHRQAQAHHVDGDVITRPHALDARYIPSDLSLRTLYGDQAISNDQKDPEKRATMLNIKEDAKDVDEPPDGGLKAWSVMLGTCLTTFAALGYVISWGVFQEYYEEVLLPGESPSDIAWIGSVQLALAFFPGLVTGRLFDIGYFKIPHFLASCLLVLCTFLVAECKVYWQFFLVQGLGIGIASGVLFGPTIAIVPHWFLKRRAFAASVCAIGSSLGGTIFPIAAQKLIPEVGFKWTMRVFGFILIAVLGLAHVTMARRLPPVTAAGGLLNWTALKNPAYAVYCLAGITAFLGMYTLLIYISISTVDVGVSNDFAFYFPAIANAVSIFGRVTAGFIADRVGAFNVVIPSTMIVAAVTIVWPYVKTEGGLIGIAMGYGVANGAYISLVCVPVMSMGSTDDVGRRVGMFLTFIGFGALVGTPISGAINSATDGFTSVGWYAGGILFFSACLLLLSRSLHLGKWKGKF